jgi:hypothetical protein
MYVVSSGWLHDSARSLSMAKVPGIAAGPTLGLTSRLWVNEYTMCVLYDTCRYGSKCGGSQSRRVIVPPRFAVWARTDAGDSVAPTRVMPPRPRRSRRFMFVLRAASNGVRAGSRLGSGATVVIVSTVLLAPLLGLPGSGPYRQPHDAMARIDLIDVCKTLEDGDGGGAGSILDATDHVGLRGRNLARDRVRAAPSASAALEGPPGRRPWRRSGPSGRPETD